MGGVRGCSEVRDINMYIVGNRRRKMPLVRDLSLLILSDAPERRLESRVKVLDRSP